MAGASSPSLVTHGLTRRFGRFVAVDHLDLTVEGTKVVGFLGPNGAGKTTALKMLTDLIFPTAGEAFLNGVSVQRDRKRALAGVGTLIETPEIYPSLTPREALEMAGRLRGLEADYVRERTRVVLEEVKMSEWIDRKTGRFSKGMKQRIHIAAALLSDPNILLLDEPSTGLDPRGMAEVREIVRGLKRSGRLVFMSSHILSEVVDVCDEVALIDRGKLLFYDTLANVSARLAGGATEVTAVFLKPLSDDELLSHLTGVPDLVSWSRAGPDRVTLRIQGGTEAQSRILETLVARRTGLWSFRESRSALEEVYLREITQGEQ